MGNSSRQMTWYHQQKNCKQNNNNFKIGERKLYRLKDTQASYQSITIYGPYLESDLSEQKKKYSGDLREVNLSSIMVPWVMFTKTGPSILEIHTKIFMGVMMLCLEFASK